MQHVGPSLLIRLVSDVLQGQGPLRTQEHSLTRSPTAPSVPA